MRYLELTDQEFDIAIKEIDSRLRKFREFTSETYMTKRLLSKNDKWLIIEPIEKKFQEALSDYDWKDEFPIFKREEI